MPALTAPTAYGPQAVVTRGGLVVRDGTGGGQNSPSSPVDKPSSTEYTSTGSTSSGGKPMRDTITAADLPPAGTFIDAATDQIGGRRVAKIRRWLENPKASESGVAGVLVEATPTSGVYGKPGYDVRATPYRAGGERLTSRTQYAHKTPTGVLDTQVTAEQAAEGFNRLASDLSEKLGLTAGDDAAFGRIFGGAK